MFQTIERYFIAVAASKKDSNGVKVYSGWRVYTDANGLPISLSTSQGDKKETVFYRARRISEHNDSLVVIDFKFSLPTANASDYSFTLKRDATPIVTFSNLATISDTVKNISSAITSCVLNSNTLVIMRDANNFYLYNIYTILPDYGKNPSDRLSGTLIKSTGEVDTAIAHIGIYGDSSYQNMISTMYDLLRVEGTIPNPIYPGTLQALPSTDTLKAKLLIAAMLDLSLPHNSPAPNSKEAAGGIFTNYIQCMDNIVRNWSTIRSGGVGLPRLRNIHTNILATNKDSVIIDPIYVKNYGTLAEYGQVKEAQKRKNYAFYEGYSRLNVDLAVRPSGSLAVPTASGLMFRISPNIQLYEANLADTFNMFDIAFISCGPLSRRIIIPSNDSLLLKFQTDGIWLKGDSTNSAEKNYYCGMEAVRLKMQSGVDSIGVPFAVTNEKEVLGDVVGSIVGDAEKSILMISNVFFDGNREDTLKATNNVRTAFRGNKRKIEYEGKYKQAKSFINFYVSSDSVNGPCRVIERGNKHIVIENIRTYNISTVIACETVQGKINRVFKADLSSSNLLFKDIYNGYEHSENKGADPIALALEKDPDAWIPIEKRQNAFVVLSWSQGVRVYSCRNDTNCIIFPRNESDEVNGFVLYPDWVSFESELLGNSNDSLYIFVMQNKPAFFKMNYGDKRYMSEEDIKKFKIAKLDPTNAKTHQNIISINSSTIEMSANEAVRYYNDVQKDVPDDKGNKNYLIAFHTAADNNNIEIELKAPSSVPKFQYEIVNKGDWQFDFGDIPKGGTNILKNLALPAGNHVDYDYKLRFGVDVNRDSKLSAKEVRAWGAEYKIYGINELDYGTALFVMQGVLRTCRLQADLLPYVDRLQVVRIGYQLTYRFIFGTYDNGLLCRHRDFIPIERGNFKNFELTKTLTNKYGFQSSRIVNNNGKYYIDVPKVEYLKGSVGSLFFANNPEILPASQREYNNISFSEVDNNFVANGQVITLPNKQLKRANGTTIDFRFNDYGVGHCKPIGDVKFRANKISNNEYEISDFSIDMVAGDINDYDYLDWTAATFNIGGIIISAPCIASTISCGFGVCGKTVGEVFYTEISFERTFTFPPRRVIR